MEPLVTTIDLPDTGTQGVSLIGLRIPSDIYEQHLPSLLVLRELIDKSLSEHFNNDPRVAFPSAVYMDRSSSSPRLAFLLCLVPSSREAAPSLHDDVRRFVKDILNQKPVIKQLDAARAMALQRLKRDQQELSYRSQALVLRSIRGQPAQTPSQKVELINSVTTESILEAIKSVATQDSWIDIAVLSGSSPQQQP